MIATCGISGIWEEDRQDLRFYYSCRSASMGSRAAARLAGQMPNRMPTLALKPNAIRAEVDVMTVCHPA